MQHRAAPGRLTEAKHCSQLVAIVLRDTQDDNWQTVREAGRIEDLAHPSVRGRREPFNRVVASQEDEPRGIVVGGRSQSRGDKALPDALDHVAIDLDHKCDVVQSIQDWSQRLVCRGLVGRSARELATVNSREAGSSDRPAYLPLSWVERLIAAIPGADLLAARLMSLLTKDSVLQVRGRRSGRMRTTLARTITVGDARYVVAIRGETQWARNLRAAGQAVLRERGQITPVRATEATGEERRAVVEAFLASSNYAPTRRIMSEILPRAEQHPVFRIEPASSPKRSENRRTTDD